MEDSQKESSRVAGTLETKRVDKSLSTRGLTSVEAEGEPRHRVTGALTSE